MSKVFVIPDVHLKPWIFDKAGFHATKSEFVDAPLIDELPLAMECKVKSFEGSRNIKRMGSCVFDMATRFLFH